MAHHGVVHGPSVVEVRAKRGRGLAHEHATVGAVQRLSLARQGHRHFFHHDVDLFGDRHTTLVCVSHTQGFARHPGVRGVLQGGVAHSVAGRPRVFGHVESTRRQLHGGFRTSVHLSVGARGVVGQADALRIDGIGSFCSEAPANERFACENVVHQIDAGHESLVAIEADAHFWSRGIPLDVNEVVFTVRDVLAVHIGRDRACSERAWTLRVNVGAVVDHGNVVLGNVAVFHLRAGVKLHAKRHVEAGVASWGVRGGVREQRPNHAFRTVRHASEVDAGLQVKGLHQIDELVGPNGASAAFLTGGQFHTAFSHGLGGAEGGVGGHLGSGGDCECQCDCEG